MDSKFLGNKTHEVKFLKQIKFYTTLFAFFLCFSLSLYKKLQSIINDQGNIRIPVLAATRGIIGITTDSCSCRQFCWKRSTCWKNSSLPTGGPICNKIKRNCPFSKMKAATFVGQEYLHVKGGAPLQKVKLSIPWANASSAAPFTNHEPWKLSEQNGSKSTNRNSQRWSLQSFEIITLKGLLRKIEATLIKQDLCGSARCTVRTG